MSDKPQETRPYNSPSRRAQSAETRERIVGAAKKLLRKSSVRDWHSLTIRAVAVEAGVNERTVYRHFTDERGLRDAVMRDLEHDAGIDLADLQLADVADVAGRIFDHVSSYAFEVRPMDATMTEAQLRRARGAARRPRTLDRRLAGTDGSGRRRVVRRAVERRLVRTTDRRLAVAPSAGARCAHLADRTGRRSRSLRSPTSG